MRKISVTEALNELKLYDSKIEKALYGVQFCGATKKSDVKVGAILRDTFNDRAKSAYQSVTDMIINRNKMKTAIVQSNADTKVVINGKEMTRAAAIERKTSIMYEENLLSQMKQNYAAATDKVVRENTKVDAKVDDLLKTLVGKETDKKIDPTSQKALEENYRQNNEYELVDPIGIWNKIQELEADINGFKSAVDTCLAISNATTFIELDF